jgi:vacuolar-type H+-ATPase subunit I/STV1
MRITLRVLPLMLASILCATALIPPRPALAQKKDYLSETEADKIRDAETTSERIKLFISFAADRIKKLQYEFAHPGELHRDERINALINAYAGCIDDGSDLIQLGVDKQQDVRDAIKEMQSKAPEFLTYLKELSAKGQAVAAYKENLDDAIDATNDAIKDAAEAIKENAPPPVRRRPQ